MATTKRSIRVELVFSRTAYRFPSPQATQAVPIDRSDVCDGYAVGDLFVVDAAAPGIGRCVYRILAVDARGLWGRLESDTVRVLHPQETR